MKVFKEFWRTVVIDGVEHPRYMVSNFGKVKCLSWGKNGKERISALNNNNGYLQVWVGKRVSVHRLVAEAFLPNPQNKPEVEHINTIRSDNVVLLDDDGQTVLYTNLKWVRHKENCNNSISIKNHKYNHYTPMLGKFGSEHNASIPIVQLTLDGQFIMKWSCSMEAKRKCGIDQSHITKCCRGKLKSAGGYKWMYLSDFQKVCKRSISEIKPLF